jgi:hypothetical protein
VKSLSFLNPKLAASAGHETILDAGTKPHARTPPQKAQSNKRPEPETPLKVETYQSARGKAHREGACDCSTYETTGLKHRRQPNVLPQKKSLLMGSVIDDA